MSIRLLRDLMTARGSEDTYNFYVSSRKGNALSEKVALERLSYILYGTEREKKRELALKLYEAALFMEADYADYMDTASRYIDELPDNIAAQQAVAGYMLRVMLSRKNKYGQPNGSLRFAIKKISENKDIVDILETTNAARLLRKIWADYSYISHYHAAMGLITPWSSFRYETGDSDVWKLAKYFYDLAQGLIHRTFCITYKSQNPAFIPLKSCSYVKSSDDGKVYLRAELTDHGISKKTVIGKLPNSFDEVLDNGQSYIQSVANCNWGRKKKCNIDNVLQLNQKLRSDLHYINGVEPLWYIKTPRSGKMINRYGPTITLAAMHRLSEICRYNPVELSKYLSGQKNWLLSEFIEMSPIQYIDEIASEITGSNFAIPNARSAN